jgi:hypothetical protein
MFYLKGPVTIWKWLTFIVDNRGSIEWEYSATRHPYGLVLLHRSHCKDARYYGIRSIDMGRSLIGYEEWPVAWNVGHSTTLGYKRL